MRVAYADPPYEGCGGHYPEGREVDPVALVAQLVADFPEGWALSCKTGSLRMLLPVTPGDTRVCAWVKPWASYKPGVHPAYAWEPVLVRGGRKPPRSRDTVRDWLACRATQELGFIGAKPEAFAYWLFGLLGLEPGDELVDLFPGTGGITAAWESARRQRVLFRVAL